MGIKNRMLFAAGSIGGMRPLSLLDLNVGDKICSDQGLKAVIKGYGTQCFYIVQILEGSAFQEKHTKEIRFNHQFARYELYGDNLTKWHREEDGLSESGGDIIQQSSHD